MEDGRQSPHLHLDLYNFEEGRGSRYVLTSPRSLEACARQGVRPVDLLHKTPDELVEGHSGASMRLVSEMYEAHEKERRKKVRICREERIQLMEEQRDWKTPGGKDSNHGLVIIEKVECPPAPTTSPDWWDKQVPSNPKEAKSPAPTTSTNCWDNPKDKPVPSNPKEVKSPTSTNCSDNPRHKPLSSNPKRATSPGHMWKSKSMGDLTQPVMEAKHLAMMVEREAQVSVPKKDKKIAALMLIKFHEEEMAKKRRLEAEQAWEGVMSEERNFRAALSKNGWTISSDRPKRNKTRTRSCKEEGQLDTGAEMTTEGDERWKKISMEQKIRLKQGLERARDEVENKKRLQEQLMQEKVASIKANRELNNQLLEERMIQAIKAKLLKEFQNKKNIQVKNEYEKLRHSRLKQQVDNQMKAVELFKRMSIQQKELKAHELYEQLIEERNRELKEKAAKEEEQIIMARIRADHQEKLHWRHKKMLVQQTEQRIQCAKDCLEKSIQTKAEKTRELNLTKEKTHLILKKRVAEEEENHRKEVEHLIRIKDKKSDKVLKEKEAVIDEGRRIARASFQIREKIREHTKCRTFDQMARQAQFNASLIKEAL